MKELKTNNNSTQVFLDTIDYHYIYKGDRERDWLLTRFSPRKAVMTFYIMTGFNNHDTLLQKSGKYIIGKSSLSNKKMKDINIDILKRFMTSSFIHIQQNTYDKFKRVSSTFCFKVPNIF